MQWENEQTVEHTEHTRHFTLKSSSRIRDGIWKHEGRVVKECDPRQGSRAAKQGENSR